MKQKIEDDEVTKISAGVGEQCVTDLDPPPGGAPDPEDEHQPPPGGDEDLGPST